MPFINNFVVLLFIFIGGKIQGSESPYLDENGRNKPQELKELKGISSLTTQISLIEQQESKDIQQTIRNSYIISGILGGLIILMIIIVIILWCICANGWQSICNLFASTPTSTSIKQSKDQLPPRKSIKESKDQLPPNQLPPPKSIKALPERETPPKVEIPKAPPSTEAHLGLLEEQSTQADPPKDNPSQSSSHPISPISKTVFDEDEPCVNPKKVKFLGNIDQLLKERPPNYKEDIEAALMEDEIEDFTQADTEHAVPPKAVKFRDERCILYLTEDIPTEDDVLENNGNSV